jgi:type IV secretory pathway VirB10-like protein
MKNGISVYLCTTKDTSPGEPIIMIGVWNDDNGKGSFVDGESWSAVQSINSESSSLTGTAKNIRLYYTNDPDADLSQPLGNSALTASLIAIGISVLGGIAILIFMKSKRGEEEAENKPRPAFKNRVRAIPAKIKGLFKKSSSDEKGEKGKKNSAVKAKKPDKQKKTDKNGQKSSKKKSGGKNDRESETVELPRDTAVKDEAEKANGNANPTGKHLSGGKGRIASLRGKRVNQKNGDNNGIAAEMEALEDEPQKKPKKAGKGRKSKKKENKKDKTVTVPETEDEITQETVSVK